MSKFTNLKISNQTEKNDCTVIALSLLCDEPYQDAYAACQLAGRKEKRGLKINLIKMAFNILDRGLMEIVNNQYKSYTYPLVFDKDNKVKVKLVPRDTGIRKSNYSKYTMRSIGQDYPTGNYLVVTDTHVAALIDGVIEDWTNNRCFRIIHLYRIMDYSV